MNSEMTISVESSLNTVCAGLTILLVDGDSTCLAIISKMLCRFGYRVTTAKRAIDAFCIIQDSQCKIDLIVAESRLPDMDDYELLETIKEMSEIPVIFMSADNDENTILSGLLKGAMLYLIKPITMYDLKNIWQFAFIKERGNMIASKEKVGIEKELLEVNESDVHVKSQRPISEGSQNHQSEKRKRSDEMDNNLVEDNDGSAAIKKPKIIWTKALHDRFLQAIEVLGIDEAHPKKILQYMNVPGLRKENVSSHLQKYRLSLKREQDANQKTMNSGSAAVYAPFDHLLPPFSPQEGSLQFSNLQFMTVADQLETNGLVQENLNGCMPIRSSGSAYLLKHVDSNHTGASIIDFEQQTPCNETPVSAYPECNLTGDPVVNNGLVDFPQIGNLEQFLEGETDFLNNGDSGLESLFVCPIEFDGSLQEKQQKQEQFLEGETDFLNIGDSGLESLLDCPVGFDGSLQQKQQKQEQDLEGETDFLNMEDYGMESLLDWPTEFDGALEGKQQQQEQFLPPEPLQLPPPLKEQEKHDVFGAERGSEFTEVLTMEKGTSELFFDEDFGDFW